MLRDGKFMICTIPELAEWLTDSIECNPYGDVDFIAEVDFTLLPITEEEIEYYSADEINIRCEMWYGIKAIDTRVDSPWINLVADLYGGGSAELVTIVEKDKGTARDIEGMICRVLQAMEGTNCDDQLLFVEILQGSKIMKNYKVTVNYMQYNDVCVEAENEQDAKRKAAEYVASCGKDMEWHTDGITTPSARELPKVKLITKQERETTWYDIEQNKDKLKIGDEIEVHLKDGTVTYAVVAAINPYRENQIAFVFKDCIGDHSMNDEDTNAGGWRDSKMREYVNTDVYELLPDDLKAVIKTREIRQRISGTYFLSVDKLWLLSEVEVFDRISDVDYEDVKFPLFEDRKNRIKLGIDCFATYWWLRSTYDTSYFRCVHSNGFWGGYDAYSSYGVALGFMI